jgi:thiol-disulfide isomerase/thioredoxin
MSDEAMADETMADGEAMELPNWFEAELTNVNTGETFKITDFSDRVVLVETMAVWCSNCLRQQREVQALHDLLGEQPALVSVALDIDPNETNDTLKAHADKNGFDWVYAVAPAEVAREIGQLYGGQFLNPPATPMLIIDRHGQVHLLSFGHKTAQSLQESLAPFLSEDG